LVGLSRNVTFNQSSFGGEWNLTAHEEEVARCFDCLAIGTNGSGSVRR
jgi:hypothetical protein